MAPIIVVHSTYTTKSTICKISRFEKMALKCIGMCDYPKRHLYRTHIWCINHLLKEDFDMSFNTFLSIHAIHVLHVICITVIKSYLLYCYYYSTQLLFSSNKKVIALSITNKTGCTGCYICVFAKENIIHCSCLLI